MITFGQWQASFSAWWPLVDISGNHVQDGWSTCKPCPIKVVRLQCASVIIFPPGRHTLFGKSLTLDTEIFAVRRRDDKCIVCNLGRAAGNYTNRAWGAHRSDSQAPLGRPSICGNSWRESVHVTCQCESLDWRTLKRTFNREILNDVCRTCFFFEINERCDWTHFLLTRTQKLQATTPLDVFDNKACLPQHHSSGYRWIRTSWFSISPVKWKLEAETAAFCTRTMRARALVGR